MRDSAAYDTTRAYHIAVTADGVSYSPPPPRALYVEHLIFQSRNGVTNVRSTTTGVESPDSYTASPPVVR